MPADMHYHDFKRVYIDKSLTLKDWQNWREVLLSDENLAKIRVAAAKSGKILTAGISRTLDAATVQGIAKIIEGAPENVRALWNLAHDDIKILDTDFKGTPHYSSSERGIYFNLKKDGASFFQKPYRTLFHESAHLIDNWLENYTGNRSATFKGGLFLLTLRKEAAAYMRQIARQKELKRTSEICAEITKELLKIPVLERREISDIWGGLTKNKATGEWGHRAAYWNSADKLAKEAFAHMFCAAMQNPESLSQITNYFRESYKVFLEMINERRRLT